MSLSALASQIPPIIYPAAIGAALEKVAMPGSQGLIGGVVGGGLYYWKSSDFVKYPGVMFLGGPASIGYLVGEWSGFSPLISTGVGVLAGYYLLYSPVAAAQGALSGFKL